MREQVINFIKDVYSDSSGKYHDFIEKYKSTYQMSIFFHFVSRQFDDLVEKLNNIDISHLNQFTQTLSDFEGNKTGVRFKNLIQFITSELLEILKECYNYDDSKAKKHLLRFLGSNTKMKRYLIEPYFNYFIHDFISYGVPLYRMRANTRMVENCWHTPFSIREKSYSGRFSKPGFPCLYLGNTPETCYEELKDKIDNKSIVWKTKFDIKSNVPIGFVDLTFPNEQIINEASYDLLFRLILMYPIKLLCGVEAVDHTSYFCEEYLFSQKLMEIISNPIPDKFNIHPVVGVKYSSVKQPGGFNYALPARTSILPPHEEYSSFLLELLKASSPEEFHI